MKLSKSFLYVCSAVCLGLSLTSCLDNNDETIALISGNRTDIPSDNDATPNPYINDPYNATIPNIQYSTVDEDGTAVFRIDMTGIQDPNTLEWMRLEGTNSKNQNVWAEIDGTPKGIKVYNTADDSDKPHNVPVDLIFLVDNSGSMSEEADVIARDISAWANKLNAGSLDIMFGCVGYDGEIRGALDICNAATLYDYLNRYNCTGTSRTVGFAGSDSDVTKFINAASSYRTGGNSSNECGMAALRFASEQFSFRNGANRIYVNFTDEPNQPNGKQRFSVESLKTDWDTSLGTIHTVFSDSYNADNYECNRLMSEYTGGTVIYTDPYFTNVTLESLPVTDAMQNSYIIRMTNVEQYIDGKAHELHLTVLAPDHSVWVERIFYVVFEKNTTRR